MRAWNSVPRELEQERQLSPLPPIVVGGILVIPAGLIAKLSGQPQNDDETAEQFARETARVEHLAMEAVMKAEKLLWLHPTRCKRRKVWLRHRIQNAGHGQIALH